VAWSAAKVQNLVGLLGRRGALVAAGRSALVMGSPLAYGFARMFQAYAEFARLPTKVGVFSDLDEALASLGIHRDMSGEASEPLDD
jgi:hypothetical protein